jgi:hypothetical protein
VAARGTVTFVAIPNGEGSRLFAECKDSQGLPKNLAIDSSTANGIMVVAAAEAGPPSLAVSENLIFGDALVVDLLLGQAYSLEAFSFRAGAGPNNGDRTYRFDGLEYQMFPARVAANFLAPTTTPNTTVGAELILFTLDGTRGQLPTPRVKTSGTIFNDSGMVTPFTYAFDCFDIVALEDLSPFFVQGLLGSPSGHLVLSTESILSPTSDSHDAEYGDGNDLRNRPVLGWLVQNTTGVLLAADQPAPGVPEISIPTGTEAAWGRRMSRSLMTVDPYLSDQNPVLAEPTATGGCGLGLELALLMPPLMWLRGRRRRSTANA